MTQGDQLKRKGKETSWTDGWALGTMEEGKGKRISMVISTSNLAPKSVSPVSDLKAKEDIVLSKVLPNKFLK